MTNFSASSLFAGVNAGVMNSYAVLSNLYKDGLTQKNLSQAMTNTNLLTSSYGTTFASYLSQNFGRLDKNLSLSNSVIFFHRISSFTPERILLSSF